MVKYSELQLDSVFHALSDQTRRDIVKRLARKQRSASYLAKEYKISFPAVSKHLKVLENAELISRMRLGRKHIFSVRSSNLEMAREWMSYWSRYWNSRLDNLEKFLLKQRKNEKL